MKPKVPTEVPEEHREVSRTDLVLREDFTVRRKTDTGTVARYVAAMRAGAEFPPVLVGNIDGALVLLDGYHRCAAYALVDQLRIQARIVTVAPAEAYWLAAEANLRHGLALTRAERKQAFKAFIGAKHHRDHRGRLLPLREVARRLGLVSHSTIYRWLQQDFPHIARQYGGAEGGGGARDTRPPTVELHVTAKENILHAVAAARGVTKPEERGEVVAAFRAALAEIEALHFVLPPEADF